MLSGFYIFGLSAVFLIWFWPTIVSGFLSAFYLKSAILTAFLTLGGIAINYAWLVMVVDVHIDVDFDLDDSSTVFFLSVWVGVTLCSVGVGAALHEFIESGRAPAKT